MSHQFHFFRELLRQNPDLPFWDEYIQLAAKVGETDKMLELARAAAGREDLSNKRRNLIRQNLYKALLAADQVDEGIKEIRQTLGNKDIKLGGRYGMEGNERGELALTLAALGRFLNRPELVADLLIVLAKQSAARVSAWGRCASQDWLDRPSAGVAQRALPREQGSIGRVSSASSLAGR